MQIGSVKKIPRPGSQAVNEAIGLLSAFGKEGGELQTLLEEMKETQVHNENVHKQLASAITENSQLVAEAKRHNTEERVQIETKAHGLEIQLGKARMKEVELKERELALEEKVSQSSIEEANAASRIKKREDQLRQSEREVEELRKAAEAEQSKARHKVMEYESKLVWLENIKAELSAVLSVINET